MINVNKRVRNMISNISRTECTNNTQRVFLDLVRARTKSGWVARTSMDVPSVGARIRDLRKPEFGGLNVECVSATDLRRPVSTDNVVRQTFYRVVPSTVTVNAVKTIFKGVI